MSDLTITGIEIRRAAVPYLRPFVISSGATAVLETLLVTVRTEDGCTGIGEVNPMTAYSGETTSGVEEAIRRYLAPAITGYPAYEIAGLHARMDAALRANALAKAAIDIAVHDLLGRAWGVPVSHLLGGPVRDRIPLAWVIGMGSLDEMVEEAARYAALGFPAIKLKIGRDPAADLAAVRAVREAIGPTVALRVDANQGYDTTTAIRTLRQMERYDLELVEQPVAGYDLHGMAALTRALDVPVMADESLQSPADALEIIRLGAADVLNIKIVKPGGLYRSRQIAALAEAAGLRCMVGSMPELGVGSIAGAHFAVATPSVTYPCEVIGPLMVEEDIVVDPVISVKTAPGYLRVPTDPGLGVTLKEQWTEGAA
jgi:muconate cycloisomerase